MAINAGKVVAGGLAAGVVLNVIDFAVSTFLLAGKFKTQLDAVNPSINAAMMKTSSMVAFVVIDFILGVVLVWAYAAMRPRFGPGSGTALKSALLIWVPGSVAWYSYVIAGMLDLTAFSMAAACALINLLIGAQVGAMIYKED